MEELAASLLGTLKRSSAPVETKLSLLNSLKSSIKHQRIPESAQPATLECIRIAITTQTSATLVTAAFQTLTHLVKRLVIQNETDALFAQRTNLVALLLEKLGDVKEAHRQASSQALSDLWSIKPNEIEKIIRESAIQGGNVRAKEAGMEWVTKMHANHALQFRNFVGPMVECLEDAEGSVRDSAKANILELFRDARDGAKADLKRQLLAYNVRRSIATHILSTLQIGSMGETMLNASTQSSSRTEVPASDSSTQEPLPTENSGSSVEQATVEPLYVESQRDLDEIIQKMQPCFENKESEDNWKARDTNTTKLRRLLKGNSPTDYHQPFLAGIKSLLDGILKVANSLRTTMATNGCCLLQELAKTLGSALDPLVDMILQGLEKMSASTKHINGINAFATIDTTFGCVSYHIRLVQHISHASQDKNVQPRAFASGWLKTILKKQMRNKSHFEHSGALELADKAIRRCLGDPNPKARENMRSTFWLFAQGWPDRAEAILSTLDVKSRQLLEKDPANPNAANAGSSFTSSVGPVSVPNPRAASTTGRSSLKDTIAAQKKAALAARRLPERPNSAMSSFSPVRQAPSSAVRAVAAPVGSQPRVPPNLETPSLTRPPLISSGTSSSLLSTAPMRRPRRPDLPRPATADMFARRPGRIETPPRSPLASPARSVASSISTVQNGTRAAMNATSSSQAHPPNFSPRMSPNGNGQRTPYPANQVSRPVIRPAGITQMEDLTSSSSPKVDDNFTIIIPRGGMTSRELLSPRSRNENGRSNQTRLSLPTMAEEDNFTLVMPLNPRSGGIGSPRTIHATQPSMVEGSDPILGTMNIESLASLNTAIQTPTVDMEQGYHLTGIVVQTAKMHDDALIIFEDPTIDNIVIPMDQIESSRNALEELHLNAQQPEIRTEQTSVEPTDVVEPSECPLFPSKKYVAGESSSETITERLEHQRLLQSLIERLQRGVLDMPGLTRLVEIITANREEGPSFMNDVLQASVDYLTSSGNSDMSFRSQLLDCIRLSTVMNCHIDQERKVLLPLLHQIILESRYATDMMSYSEELEKTTDDILLHLGDTTGACVDQLCSYDWHETKVGTTQSARKLITITAMRTISKLVLQLTATHGGLTPRQRTRLSSLALRNLANSDSEIRRATVDFCLDLYSAFGAEHKGEFWRVLSKAGEAQMNLVVYYMARSRRFLPVGAAVI